MILFIDRTIRIIRKLLIKNNPLVYFNIIALTINYSKILKTKFTKILLKSNTRLRNNAQVWVEHFMIVVNHIQ